MALLRQKIELQCSLACFLLFYILCPATGFDIWSEKQPSGDALRETALNESRALNASLAANRTAKAKTGVFKWLVDEGVLDPAWVTEQTLEETSLGSKLDKTTILRIEKYIRESNKTLADLADVDKRESYIEGILRKMNIEDAEKGSGRFNQTMEKQEGKLETVARVGKQHKQGIARNDSEVVTLDPIGDHEKHSESTGSKLGFFQRDDELSQESATAKGDAVSRAEADKKAEAEFNEENDDGKEDVPRLIDSQDNEYVISNPGKGLNQMQLQQDLTLISDIVKVIVAAALGGLLCGLLGQPVLLGYIAAGMIVGPGGLGLVHELVQVETLAQFGVVFLLFALGVEFSIVKMQGVQAVAIGGGTIQIIIAMVLGGMLGSTVTQGVFVGAFLSMSSTTVVIKCLMDTSTVNTEHGQIMLGTLILQDCALGLLLAVLPALASKDNNPLAIAGSLAREGILLLGFVGVAWLVARLFVPRFLRMLSQLALHDNELYQLGVVAVCLCVALLSEFLGLSLEVGAFVAGLMLSGSSFSERTLQQVEPVRNIFAALFLASVGMVMHPLFLWQHIDVLLTATAVVFFGKTILATIIVRVFKYDWGTALSVGIALAQIGEFSFVLLSRAQALGLVSRSLYLLLMGTTALSLVLTPFAFKIVRHIVPLEHPSRDRRTSRGELSDARELILRRSQGDVPSGVLHPLQIDVGDEEAGKCREDRAQDRHGVANLSPAMQYRKTHKQQV